MDSIFVNQFDLVLSLLLTDTGLYFANNYRRQSRFRVADARRTAYAALYGDQ